MEATVASILSIKGNTVTTVSPGDDLAAVAKVLTEHNIGACPVVESRGIVVGMISERDIVRKVAQDGKSSLTMSVSETMTRNVRTCGPGDKISRVMEIMTSIRARHLPVISQERLVGIVSIGDVVKQRLEAAEYEVDTLRTFIAS